LDRADHIDQWVSLHDADEFSGQPDQKRKPGRPQGGIAKAARDLPVPGKTTDARRKFIERAIKTASIAPEAKVAARNAGLANNQSALLAIANEPTLEAQLANVEVLSASKRAKLKQNSIDGETPVAGSPASTPADSPNPGTKPDEDKRSPTPVGGIGGDVPVAGSPASGPEGTPNTRTRPNGDGLDIPDFLKRHDATDEAFADLVAGWRNADEFRRAWANAPVTVRDKFYAEVMQGYCE
jgi:hypothetical protein